MSEPYQRLWTVEWEHSMYRRPAEVVWDAPNAQELLSAAAVRGYTVRGPFVLAGAGWHVSPAPNTPGPERRTG